VVQAIGWAGPTYTRASGFVDREASLSRARPTDREDIAANHSMFHGPPQES